MKILTSKLFFVSWLLMSCAVGTQPGAIAETQEGPNGSQTPSVSDVKQKKSQGMDQLGTAGMRVEEPDGTILPPALPTMPESSMSVEGLNEVPDAEGKGTMVNIEGRFQSILKVPEGSDEAIHVDTDEEQKQ